jgi:hypothetical protein
MFDALMALMAMPYAPRRSLLPGSAACKWPQETVMPFGQFWTFGQGKKWEKIGNMVKNRGKLGKMGKNHKKPTFGGQDAAPRSSNALAASLPARKNMLSFNIRLQPIYSQQRNSQKARLDTSRFFKMISVLSCYSFDLLYRVVLFSRFASHRPHCTGLRASQPLPRCGRRAHHRCRVP